MNRTAYAGGASVAEVAGGAVGTSWNPDRGGGLSGPPPSDLPAPDYRARRATVWLWLPAILPALTLDLTFICFSFTPDV